MEARQGNEQRKTLENCFFTREGASNLRWEAHTHKWEHTQSHTHRTAICSQFPGFVLNSEINWQWSSLVRSGCCDFFLLEPSPVFESSILRRWRYFCFSCNSKKHLLVALLLWTLTLITEPYLLEWKYWAIALKAGIFHDCTLTLGTVFGGDQNQTYKNSEYWNIDLQTPNKFNSRWVLLICRTCKQMIVI